MVQYDGNARESELAHSSNLQMFIKDIKKKLNCILMY